MGQKYFSGFWRTAIFSLFLFLLPSPIWAQSDTDVTALFCPEIDDANSYNRSDFRSYRMLRAGDNGWIYRSHSDFRQDFSMDEETKNNLSRLDAVLGEKGIRLVILLTPTRGMMHPQNIRAEDIQKYGYDVNRAWKSYYQAADTIRQLGIDVVTLDRPTQEISFFYKRDHHWNPDGAKMAAQELAEYIKNMDVYDEIEKVEFQTHTGNDYAFEGVSKKVFKTLCDTIQPPEYIKLQYTEPVEETSGESALFGEAKKPEIVLAGTSNSTQIPSYANFEGFLKEALSTDILNMSVSGGGLDTAMLAYFKSDFYKNDPSKILIWEVPSYYDLNNHKEFFRKVIPSTFGSCKEDAVVASENFKLRQNSELIFNNLEEHRITGSNYYVYIMFEKPVVAPFKVDLRYQGNRDRFRFKPTNRDTAAGPYVMILKDDKQELLSKVGIWSSTENLGSTVNVYVCRRDGAAEPKSSTGVRGMLEKVKGIFKKNKE